MSAIDQINANGQDYDIMSPEVVSDYVEKLGTICKNPNGYTKGSLFLARDAQDVERMYKATAIISSNQTITVGTNCEHKKLGDLFNAVDSEVGNVKQALSDEVSARSFLGAHNLAKNFKGASEVISGITFIRNADDSIHIVYSGESAFAEYNMTTRADKNFYLPNGKYILSVGTEDVQDFILGIGCGKNGQWTRLAWTNGAAEVEFTVDGDDYTNDGAYLSLYIQISATDIDKTFYPMIRLATDADSSYSKPVLTNSEITDKISGKYTCKRVEVSVLGDGVMTVGEAMASLYAAIRQQISTDSALEAELLYMKGYSECVPMSMDIITSISVNIFKMGRVEFVSNKLKNIAVMFAPAAADCLMVIVEMASDGTQTITHYENNTLPLNNVIAMQIMEYFEV